VIFSGTLKVESRVGNILFVFVEGTKVGAEGFKGTKVSLGVDAIGTALELSEISGIFELSSLLLSF
jgi:hypothetical protein